MTKITTFQNDKNMKKTVLTLVALFALSFASAQTENDFFGVPMMKDFKAGAKVLEDKGFEIVSSASDSILLEGSHDLFGECQVILREICQKIICRNNESVDNALNERFENSSISEDGYEGYHISEYRMALISKDSAFTRIVIVDLADMFTIKFKGVSLGSPLKEVLPQLQKDFDYVSTYKGFTILKGKFAGYRDCTIYVGAENEDEIVSLISVYFPTINNWNALYTQYCNLKKSLTEKYGEPYECEEDLIGRRQNKILDLINGEISCNTIFSASVMGRVKLSLFGYEDLVEGAVCLTYTDLLSVKKQKEIDDDDL